MERLLVEHELIHFFNLCVVVLLLAIHELLQGWWHEECCTLILTTAGLAVLALARIG